MNSPHPPLYCLVLVAVLAAPMAAQDTVTLHGKTGGETRVTGRIVDYTGRELTFELPGGTTQRFPSEQVARVHTQRTPEHIQADQQFVAGQFSVALAGYRRALEVEPRRFVRREILAQAVRCYGTLGRFVEAGKFFLLLVEDDPDTQYFDCIPLGWVPVQPDAALEQAARGWLDSDQPVAVLLGASHLLSTSVRPRAVARLNELRSAADVRVAQLAEAQRWRVEGRQSNPAQREAWLLAVEALPEPLQAGPYFAIGQAQAQVGEYEQAALSLLRVAIVHSGQRSLAGRATLEAGRVLEQLGHANQAARLYDEVVRDYQDQPRTVAEAEARLAEQ